MSKIIKAMVDRFLAWPLPKGFAPDCHITFKLPDPVLNPNPSWPVGTNLFSADQAKELFETVLNSVADDADKWRTAQMLGIVTPDVEARIARARGV
jgi:hypothetical protein